MESGIFINKYNLNKKKYKSSLSTNKREKRKIKSKSKRKKLSLPKKKYLEEISDSSSDKDNFYLDKNNSNFNIDNIDNSFDKHIINNNFSIKTNNNIIQPLIYKTTKINNNNNKNKTYQINTNKYKKIPEKNIVTADKRLFININYISCLSYENNISSKIKYKNSSLIIKRNIYFPIFSQKIIRNKTTSSNFINISNNNRNSNTLLERKNKKMNAPHAGHRREINDRPTVILHTLLHNLFHHEEQPACIHVHHRIPVLLRDLKSRFAAQKSRRLYQTGNLPHLCTDFLYHRRNLIRARQIQFISVHLAILCKIVNSLRDPFLSDINNRNPGAVLQKHTGNNTPDSACAACDNRQFPF